MSKSDHDILEIEMKHENLKIEFYRDKVSKLYRKIDQLKADQQTLIKIIEDGGIEIDENILKGIKIRIDI